MPMTNSEAFAAIVANDKLLKSTVSKLALGTTKEDREDIVSSITLSLVDLLTNNYDASKGMKVSTYIYMATKSRIVDCMRARRFGTSLDSGADDSEDSAPISNEIASMDPDGFMALAAKQTQEEISSAFATLPEGWADFANDAFGDDMAVEDLAVKYGIAANTVYSRKYKIRDLIAKALG